MKQNKSILKLLGILAIFLVIASYNDGNKEGKKMGCSSGGSSGTHQTCSYVSSEPATYPDWLSVLNSNGIFGDCNQNQEGDNQMISCGNTGDLPRIMIIGNLNNPVSDKCSDYLVAIQDDIEFTHPNIEFFRKNTYGVNEYNNIDNGMPYIIFCSKDDKFAIQIINDWEPSYFNNFYTYQCT